MKYSKSTSQQYPQQQFQENFWKSQPIAVVAMLLAAVFSGSALAQSDSPFAVQNQKKKNFPAAEAARIYEAVCVVVAREVRPEHPPLLQPRFTLVLGADRDELVQQNQVAELHLTSWDREKFAQALVVLAVREILKADSVPTLSRRALAWTDAVVPMTELANAK
jgi:hypothetical protein